MLAAVKAHTLSHRVSGILSAAALLSAASLQAGVENISQALGIAMQHEAISAEGKSIRLYSLSAHYNGANKRWNFQFYSSGENLHNITVTASGNAFHGLRNIGQTSLFKDIDFSRLPAPGEVLVDDLITRGKQAITKLGFIPADSDKLYIRYQLRNDPRQKHSAYHSWSVTIPVADGKNGKTVTLKNGEVDTITNAILSGN